MSQKPDAKPSSYFGNVVTCGRGSSSSGVAMLCTSGFVDDFMFAHEAMVST